MAKIRFISKLAANQTLAKIAIKHADQSVAFRRFALGTYKNTKATMMKGSMFKRPPLQKSEFIGAIPTINKAMQEKKIDSETLFFAKKMMAALSEGGKGLRRDEKNRQRAAKALVSSLGTNNPKRIDRIVNAHGNGVVFRRVGGRIVPIRKK